MCKVSNTAWRVQPNDQIKALGTSERREVRREGMRRIQTAFALCEFS